MVKARRRVDRHKREETRNKPPSHEGICDAETEAGRSSPEEKARTPETESGRMKPKPEPKSGSFSLSKIFASLKDRNLIREERLTRENSLSRRGERENLGSEYVIILRINKKYVLNLQFPKD